MYNSIQRGRKMIKSDNFCYRKVRRAITKWGAMKKTPTILKKFTI